MPRCEMTAMGSAEDLPFVFDRFYRVHTGKAREVEGNGLGLAIVKAIVEQHNGQINVESEQDKGSCFRLTLPVMQNELLGAVKI